MKNKNLRILFYSFWSIISLIQAAFTNLLFDEAYYWKYQTQLDWGYFDHPPMIAWLIKPGYTLFGNELGVRFSIILLLLLMIYLLEYLVRPKNLKLFYALISSIAIFHFIGFLALPDLPLLFFTTTFFIAYNHYLKKDSFKNNVFLAIAIALLLYTKYHGILVVFFTVLSNIKLFRKRSFWVVTAIALLLYLPHILWQYDHDWASFRFHLIERRYNDYEALFTFEYLIAQPIISGPLVGIPLIWFFFKTKPKTNFQNALKYTGIGVYVFFFISSFKGHVESNWTFTALIPLILLGYDGIEKSQKTTSYIYRTFPISLILILAIRFYLLYDFLPNSWDVKTEFHQWKSWAKTIKNHTEGKTVIFANSYQKASFYEFYSGDPSYSFNNVWGRKNQFSIWDITQNQCWENDVALIHNFSSSKDDSLLTNTEMVYFDYLDDFMVLPFITIVPRQKYFQAKPMDTMNVSFEISKKGHESFNIDSMSVESYITYEIYSHDILIKGSSGKLILTDELIESGEGNIKIQIPKTPDIYYFGLSIKTGVNPPTINSYKYKLVVE